MRKQFLALLMGALVLVLAIGVSGSIAAATDKDKDPANGGKDMYVNSASAVIKGTAPLSIYTIVMDGEALKEPELSWSTAFAWSVPVSLVPGENDFRFLGLDADGNLVASFVQRVFDVEGTPAPAIDSVSPAVGPTAGGTRSPVIWK